MTRSPAAILAGGQSRRFGSPKEFATIGGIPIAIRTRDALSGAGVEAAVIGNDALAKAISIPNIPDRIPNLGPLGGLHSALEWALSLSAPGVLCVACDMPFLSSALLRHLIQLGEAGDANMVIPRPSNVPQAQTLCAWYSVGCAPAVAARLTMPGPPGGLRELLPALSVRALGDPELHRFGDPNVLFMNVNTPADLVHAEAVIEQS